MAMDLVQAEIDFATVIAQGMGDAYGDGDPTDYEEFAAILAPALVEVLQHIIDNAETSNGGTIS